MEHRIQGYRNIDGSLFGIDLIKIVVVSDGNLRHRRQRLHLKATGRVPGADPMRSVRCHVLVLTLVARSALQTHRGLEWLPPQIEQTSACRA